MGTQPLDHVEFINFPLKLAHRSQPWPMWREIATLCGGRDLAAV